MWRDAAQTDLVFFGVRRLGRKSKPFPSSTVSRRKITSCGSAQKTHLLSLEMEETLSSSCLFYSPPNDTEI